MSKKIYVGNLPYSADEDSLRELFGKSGEVQSVKIITDAATGRPRGFGFIEMTSDEDAAKAIASLNGYSFMDRTLVVNEARPQTEKRRTGRQRGAPGGRGKGFGNWR